MNPTTALHDLGQSLWLDNITRTLLDDGTLARYIRDYAVTGLTSNPSIFEKALAHGDAYDVQIQAAPASLGTEDLFSQLALADLARAADLFRPAHAASGGTDGWVSMEVSPLLADDAQATVAAAQRLHQQGARDNLFIKIPGTPAGAKAIENAIFAGIPINVTLLFSPDQYLTAAQAWASGIERRLAAGLSPVVHSVASLFVSRWDVAVKDKVPAELHNRLGIAIAQATYRGYRELLHSPRWRKLKEAGAPLQRLLWASTGTKDPAASDVLYIEALAAPETINTIPDKTLAAFAEHGRAHVALAADGGDCEHVLGRYRQAGIDLDQLALQLQREGAEAFVTSWKKLMAGIEAKR
ncbi:MAG: transaldolase [Burkholderiaceae bacterium]|nr:MAG: transaldolase [Burkholderiaceae bacterium]